MFSLLVHGTGTYYFVPSRGNSEGARRRGKREARKEGRKEVLRWFSRVVGVVESIDYVFTLDEEGGRVA